MQVRAHKSALDERVSAPGFPQDNKGMEHFATSFSFYSVLSFQEKVKYRIT